MTSRKKDEFVPLYSLILWLLEKELNSNVDIYKAYNNVGHHLTRLFIHNKYCSFFRITTDITTDKEQISKLPDGAIQVIADFLKKIKNKQGSDCFYYEIALRDLDLILATPSMNISSLHKIEAIPNYGLYKEIGNIVKTFMNSRVVTDHVELFLSSLLRRWGNPKVYRYYVEGIEDFKTAEFVKSDFSNTVFGIVLNSNLINLNQNVGKSTLEIDQLKKENEELQQKLTSNEDEYINLAIDLKATENTLNRIVAENEKLKAELAEKDKIINQLQEDKKSIDHVNNLNELKQESDKDFKINEQEEKIKQLILANKQFSNEIFCLKGKILAIAMLNDKQDRVVGEVKEDDLDLTPEQEISNSRKRNNVLKILSILSQMADLPPEPFTAFNMLEAYAIQNNKEIPSKHTVAEWLKKAKYSS